MRRAEVQTKGGSFVIKSYDNVPGPDPKGLIVKTSFCGVCHSDLHLWADGKLNFPNVYGHEVSGTVHLLGDDIDKCDLHIGDNVIVYPWVGCGKCDDCISGDDLMCQDRSHETGCGADGGYSNYVKVSNVKFAVKVPSSIPMDIACMLPCSGLTSYSAVAKIKPYIVKIKKQAHVLIVGAGGLGLWCLQWCKICLPEGTNIISADISENKLKSARDMGANDVILWDIPKTGEPNITDTFTEEIIQKSSGGFDAVFDFVNNSVTSERAHAALKRNGSQVVVGLFKGVLKVDLPIMVRSLKRILSSYCGTMQELHELVKIVSNNKVKPPPITHYDVEDVSKAWDKLRAGDMDGRGIIKHN